MISQQPRQEVTPAQGFSLVEYRVGPGPDGPKRCLHCLQEFKAEEPWQRMTAPDGSYSIGIHSACLNMRATQA